MATNDEVYQDDVFALLRALGLSDSARPYSAHEVVQREILPAIRAMVGKRHFWLVMRYACNRCGHRMDFYLEDGCEGPRDREVPVPPEFLRSRTESPVRDQLPSVVPQTASGRYVLPVPFIAAGCPKCQWSKPWSMSGGVLQHVDWHDEPRVNTAEPPADAGRFHYPADWTAPQACGESIMPAPHHHARTQSGTQSPEAPR